MLALGLYLLSHHLENNGAKEMMKREFKVENQELTLNMDLECYF